MGTAISIHDYFSRNESVCTHKKSIHLVRLAVEKSDRIQRSQVVVDGCRGSWIGTTRNVAYIAVAYK